ncbi:MAG: hypothetical protein L6Q38_15045, partial [Nitrospira sp.]|nr:hypothetical protein [Nitrospira sp.]
QGHFSATPDGSRVASYEEGHFRITNLVSGATHQVNVNASDGVESCFRPDGQRLAFSPALGQVAVLDTDSLQIVATFEAHRNTVTALAFSPDGRRLASGSLDGTIIRITDVAVRPPVLIATLHGHASFILGLGFSPDGSLLASSDLNRSLRLWDTRSGNLRAVLQTEGANPSFLPDGRTLIIGHADGVRFWDVRSLDARVLRGHRSYVYPVLISPDGATVYSGGWDGFAGHAGSLRFWDAATGEEIAAWGAAGRWVRAAALSTDGSRLAVSVFGASERFNRVEVLDTATGTTVAAITELGEDHVHPPIDSLAFHPAAETLFWVDHLHGVAYLADARTGVLRKSRELDVRDGGQGYARVAWSRDGAFLVVCQGSVPTIDLLDGQSLELVRRWPHGHGRGVRSVAFSPDSRRILTTSEDGIVRVWDTATRTRLHDLIGHEGRVLCAIYSPDGKRIASGGDDDNIRIWDAETFHPVARLAGHEDYVYSLAWRADSQQLISGSGDNTVRLWDTQPLKDRVLARRERQTLLAQVEPMVQQLFAELDNAQQVVARLKADPSLTTRSRQIALQVALRESLARQQP